MIVHQINVVEQHQQPLIVSDVVFNFKHQEDQLHRHCWHTNYSYKNFVTYKYKDSYNRPPPPALGGGGIIIFFLSVMKDIEWNSESGINKENEEESNKMLVKYLVSIFFTFSFSMAENFLLLAEFYFIFQLELNVLQMQGKARLDTSCWGNLLCGSICQISIKVWSLVIEHPFCIFL